MEWGEKGRKNLKYLEKKNREERMEGGRKEGGLRC
jgi:hypothetical protein